METAHRVRILLFCVLILLPVAMRLTTHALTARGDTSPARRAQVLEYFTADDIRRGREYRQAFQPGGAIADVIYWGLVAWLVFGGAARRLADRAAELAGGHLLLELVIIGVPLFLLLRLALLPTTIYNGYHLEGEFGFRRLELVPWLVRLSKTWAVAGVFQLLVAAGFFWLVRHLGERWPWPALAGGAAISFIAIILWPLIVLPLFHTVRPLPAGELRREVEALTARAGIELGDIRVIDESRVSGHTNAFFTGIGNRRSIYLYDTLIADHTDREILAVVAHEIGHWRHRHMLKGWAIGIAGMAIGLFLLRWLLQQPALRAALDVRGAGDLAIIPLLWALSGAAGLVTSPAESALSRRFERQADRASLALTADPATLIDMQRKLAISNRADLLPSPLVVIWYATHPPAIERIEAAAAARTGHDAS